MTKPGHITKRRCQNILEWHLELLKQKKFLALQRDLKEKISWLENTPKKLIKTREEEVPQ